MCYPIFLETIFGSKNLGVKEFSPAEQTHLSVQNYLGISSTLFILENVRKLMDRNIQHNKLSCHQSNKFLIRSDTYNKSPSTDYLRQADLESRMSPIQLFIQKMYKRF